MTMRSQLVGTASELLDQDPNLAVVLGDIGVWGFRNAFEKHPERVLNIGILEQGTISMAAGMAMTGMIPIVHTIAPFLVERAYEQLKVDFCYQNLGGNFVSVGGSFDYAALGPTHHCPGDVAILKQLPGMEIVVPGTSSEFASIMKQAYANGKPTYFRLSERENSESHASTFGKAEVIQRGSFATVIAVGPILDTVIKATAGYDVTILYYTTLKPFDKETLNKHCDNGKVLICEPFYKGTLASDVIEALNGHAVCINNIGMPNSFLDHYGTRDEHDHGVGLDSDSMRVQLEKLL